MKYTFTIAGRDEEYLINSNYDLIDGIIKKAMRWQISKNLGNKLFPIHASLISKDGKGILLCGASGSGKSTLTQCFKEKQNYTVLANDFVVIWEKEGELFGGNLDLKEYNEKNTCTRIDKVLFLAPSDKRDIFRFNDVQAREFYTQAMYPWDITSCAKHSDTPLFKRVFQNGVCLGNRISEDRTFSNYEFSNNALNYREIGVIGLGVLGQDVSNLLVSIPDIQNIYLYSRNIDRVRSIALDLASTGTGCTVTACKSPAECIENSEILVFCYRIKASDRNKITLTEEEKLNAQSQVLWDYSRILRKVKFKGTVLIQSNPVDDLCARLYTYTNMSSMGIYDWEGLFSNQVYGIGIGLDYSRLCMFTNKKLEVIGRHNSSLSLALPINDDLCVYQDPDLLGKVNSFSERIRAHTDRTRFGPSHDALNVVKKILSNDSGILRVSSMTSKGNFCGQPMFLQDMLPRQKYNGIDPIIM